MASRESCGSDFFGPETIDPHADYLSSQVQLLDHFVVFSDVLSLEIIQKLSSSGDHLQQTAPGMIVLFVNLEMFGEFVDALRQKRNLHLGRSCVVIVDLKIVYYLFFYFFC